ncbi:pyridoxine 5'-phosphate synthase [Gimesia benthica]|uniref:Pyridoxine 5'-phosphate synthase n=1 Tax=Gimesia benthica TaxID=2608982 RepID=A0A6I6AI08_9PLAN|nr:pyridoxine 5'-phosphate synthase [Gimesia benthica]QGQ25908.1 pyridoxine 5'-phosphate synthase [Gimesia benthica]
MPALGVNIDHVATVRQARLTFEPDPVWAAVLAELGGADGITLHLREDRRHIQDHDLYTMKKTVQVKLNLEMAAEEEMTAIALEVRPDQVSLVPEKREELTTEGGLDVVANLERVEQCVHQLQQVGIEVSLFIDPDVEQIAAAKQVGVHAVELHTGRYADATSADEQQKEYDVIVKASEFTVAQGLKLHMGHGLTYRNVSKIAAIPDVCELNIGHSIVSRAVLVGMEQAVREMKALVTV